MAEINFLYGLCSNAPEVQRVNLAELKILTALARKPNLTRVARELNTSQPRLSQHLSKIERELGVALFERTSRGLTLTRAAETFMPFAGEMLRAYTDGMQALSEQEQKETRKLRLGVDHTASASCQQQLVALMQRVSPGIKVLVTRGSPITLSAEVEADELDACACFEGQDFSSLKWMPLFTTRLAGFSAGKKVTNSTVSLEEFSRLPLVLPSKRSGIRRVLEKHLKRAKLKPHVMMEVDDPAMMKSLIKSGEAAAILPEVTFTATTHLLRTEIDRPMITVTGGLLHRPNPSRTTELFLKAVYDATHL
jgi:LysR family transcriptional regulator, nitrogen assimilation regulatory protein